MNLTREYLLGELIEIIYESAKEQFIFTSHNLRVLEKLPYKSIILTTINPKNRYIRFNGVKPNNNIRDFYYTSIMLGGQKETLYNETKIIRLKEPLERLVRCMNNMKKVILSELIDTSLVRFEVLRGNATASISTPYYKKT